MLVISLRPHRAYNILKLERVQNFAALLATGDCSMDGEALCQDLGCMVNTVEQEVILKAVLVPAYSDRLLTDSRLMFSLFSLLI